MSTQMKILLGLASALGVTFYVLARNSTPPTVRKALNELNAWLGLEETDREAEPLLVKYWKTVFNGSDPRNVLGPDWTQVPWSAAFISWIANDAEPGSLPAADSHWQYAHRSMQGEGRYRVLRSEQTPVKVGDLILRWRNTPRTFEDISRLAFSESHVDIITGVDQKRGVAHTVGGNKGNAVMAEDYTLTSHGTPAAANVIAILRRT